MDDDEIRPAACRAFNAYHADIFREYADRTIPVAVIRMHTPNEAIAELEYAVSTLKMKAVMAGHVLRPIPAAARISPEAAHHARWLDNLCIDSEYDYDPVWAKCEKLRISPTFHSAAMGWGSRTSVFCYIYNHIGHFAETGETHLQGALLRRRYEEISPAQVRDFLRAESPPERGSTQI